MLRRRDFLIGTGAALGALSIGRSLAKEAMQAGPSLGPRELPAGALETSALQALPGKEPLIRRSLRPPNFETPVRNLGELFTENRSFFVRYHLLSIPEVDAQRWRLRVGGEAAEKPTELGLEDLRKGFELVELAAVCQCAGNRRGLSDPHVPGIQWGYGAIGNARWRGVRLRDVLSKAGVRKDAVEVAFDGADAGVLPKTPDFVKSLPLWKALDENTLIAFEMNGEPLPRWNGSPARLVVPGWTATYWIKHLVSIDVTTKPFDGFWMKTAYRIPKGLFPVVDRFVSQESEANTPITEMVVNSLVTNLEEGQRVRRDAPIEVKGLAWDGGYGIVRVDVSKDGGRTWSEAALGRDLGRFAWRTWSWSFRVEGTTAPTLCARATNRVGATQTFAPLFNPAGYHHNVVQQIPLTLA